MEQKKKKQEDVLVVRDEKTGEISVVAGLDARAIPRQSPPSRNTRRISCASTATGT